MPAQHSDYKAAGGLTSKLCLLLQVKVPISPMGDAHLRYHIYHNKEGLSSFFVKNIDFYLLGNDKTVKFDREGSKNPKIQYFVVCFTEIDKR